LRRRAAVRPAHLLGAQCLFFYRRKHYGDFKFDRHLLIAWAITMSSMPTQKLETPKPINRPQAPYESTSRAAEQLRLKALVAETDSPLRNRLIRQLSGDCQVVCAETVRRAARLIQRNHFDLVICDQKLPSGGGMALIDFVKLQTPETFVVLAMDEFDARIRSQSILLGGA
jgi:CheY-like chemotaxis protein